MVVPVLARSPCLAAPPADETSDACGSPHRCHHRLGRSVECLCSSSSSSKAGSVSGMVLPSSVITLMFAPPGSSGAILTQPVASADAPSARPTQECVRFDRRDAPAADDRTPLRWALAGTSAEQNRRSAARSLSTPLRSSGARMSFREPYAEGHSDSSAGSPCFRRKPPRFNGVNAATGLVREMRSSHGVRDRSCPSFRFCA